MQRSNIGFENHEPGKIKNKGQGKKKRKLLPILVFVFLFLMLTLGVGSYILIKYLANQSKQDINETSGTANNSEWLKLTEATKDDIKSKGLKEERGGESDVLSDGAISIVLNFTERREAIEGDRAREGYEFIILNLNIRNQKYEEAMFYNTNFILRDSRYTEYSTKSVKSDEINLLKGMQNIPAREGIDGSIIYEVQRGVGVLEFLYMGKKKLVFEIE